MASGRMISSQILDLCSSVWESCVRTFTIWLSTSSVPKLSVVRRRRHLEDAIPSIVQKRSAKSATTHVVHQHVAERNLLGTWIIGLSPAPRTSTRTSHSGQITRKETSSREQGFFTPLSWGCTHATLTCHLPQCHWKTLHEQRWQMLE